MEARTDDPGTTMHTSVKDTGTSYIFSKISMNDSFATYCPNIIKKSNNDLLSEWFILMLPELSD